MNIHTLKHNRKQAAIRSAKPETRIGEFLKGIYRLDLVDYDAQDLLSIDRQIEIYEAYISGLREIRDELISKYGKEGRRAAIRCNVDIDRAIEEIVSLKHEALKNSIRKT